jgi:hypothetical protein
MNSDEASLCNKDSVVAVRKALPINVVAAISYSVLGTRETHRKEIEAREIGER